MAYLIGKGGSRVNLKRKYHYHSTEGPQQTLESLPTFKMSNLQERKAQHIEIRLYEKGIQGFDIIDDGIGISENEFKSDYVRCMPKRERNEIYKTRSIGYRGEALDSLSRASDFTSRQLESLTQLNSIQKISRQGTLVQVRNIHKQNQQYHQKFIKNNMQQYNQLESILKQYAMILYNKEFKLTNSPLALDNTSDKILDNMSFLEENLRGFLDKYFKNQYPHINKELDIYEDSLINNSIKIKTYLTRPGYSKKGELKQFHLFLNERPVEGTKRLKGVFQQLYKDFMIPEKTIPFVFVHIETHHTNYDLKLMADQRKFFFKPESEKLIYEKLRSFFLQKFNQLCPKYTDEQIKQCIKQQGMYDAKSNYSQSSDEQQNSDLDEKQIQNQKRKKKSIRKLQSIQIQPKYGEELKTNEELNEVIQEIQEQEELWDIYKTDFSQDSTHKVKLTQNHLAKFKKFQSCPNTQNVKQNETQDLLTETEISQDSRQNENTEILVQENELEVKKIVEGVELPEVENLSQLATTVTIPGETNNVIAISTTRSETTMTFTARSSILSQLDQEELNEHYNIYKNDKTLQFGIEQMITYINYQNQKDTLQFDQNNIALQENFIDLDPQAELIKRVQNKKKYRPSFILRLNRRYQQLINEMNYDKFMHDFKNDDMKKIFEKREFRKLKTIGQFNDGFILCTLNKNDLFILDQHACDERYNLERLTAKLKVDSQPLMQPIFTDLALGSYNLVQKYERIFNIYGFKFEKLERASFLSMNSKEELVCLKIRSLPQSNDTQFEESDFHNLLTALRGYDSDPVLQQRYKTEQQLTEFVIPRKIHAVLALRACRSSFMIGDKLNSQQIRDLIDHLYKLKEPWICAHGRPTMRYIMNIEDLKQRIKTSIICQRSPPKLLELEVDDECFETQDNYNWLNSQAYWNNY
ncbi:dna mismatch repair protein [Stylonychia lemnae]|uniref:Dna mismatch repair protein n=1 Tax=Stylonychia lemnae TaxID=5949 RepID=A0A077ZT87_STYLE|nr:dna mismatch repair protein [Stylonychia lemnae]|eukprot:CDW73097.1 dna mismatch repair protein [Stylonychia lemnae]